MLQGVATLGLDVDGPIYRLGSILRTWLVSRGYRPELLPKHPTKTYDLLATWPLTKTEFVAELHAASEAGAIYREGDVHPDAAYWMPRIAEAGIRIHLVTARNEPRSEEHSIHWFAQKGLPYDRLTLRADKENVDDYDVLLDDAPHNVEAVLNANRKAVLLDRSWNRDATHLPRASWDEAGQTLLGNLKARAGV